MILSFVFLISITINTTISSPSCEHDTLISSQYSVIHDLEILVFDSCEVYCELKLNATTYVEFNLRQTAILSDSLNFEDIFVKNQIPLIADVTFFHLQGIDVRKKLLKNNLIMMHFVYSSFEFYLNETRLDQSQCEASTFLPVHYFFKEVSGISFRKVNYPQQMCPLIFAESQVKILIFDDISNSFLTQNQLRFANRKTVVNVNVVKFLVFYIRVSDEMLNINLFENITEIHFTHIVAHIDVELFGRFRKLKNLHFKLDNFEHFFHSVNGTKWMTHLNENTSFNLLTVLGSLKASMMLLRFQHPKNHVSFNRIYTYPNEDICLFKDFPHSRLVYALIESGARLECTCTLQWLQLHARLYASKVKPTYDYALNYVDDYNLLKIY